MRRSWRCSPSLLVFTIPRFEFWTPDIMAVLWLREKWKCWWGARGSEVWHWRRGRRHGDSGGCWGCVCRNELLPSKRLLSAIWRRLRAWRESYRIEVELSNQDEGRDNQTCEFIYLEEFCESRGKTSKRLLFNHVLTILRKPIEGKKKLPCSFCREEDLSAPALCQSRNRPKVQKRSSIEHRNQGEVNQAQISQAIDVGQES